MSTGLLLVDFEVGDNERVGLLGSERGKRKQMGGVRSTCVVGYC